MPIGCEAPTAGGRERLRAAAQAPFDAAGHARILTACENLNARHLALCGGPRARQRRWRFTFQRGMNGLSASNGESLWSGRGQAGCFVKLRQARAARPQRRARAQEAPAPAAPGWPNRRLLDLLKIDHPIIQAPMGGAVSPAMTVAVCGAGGLGSFPCSFLPVAPIRDIVAKIRAQTARSP